MTALQDRLEAERRRLEAERAGNIEATSNEETMQDAAQESDGNGRHAVEEPERVWRLQAFGLSPLSPHILPDERVAAKLAHFHELRKQGITFNATLQANKSIRNPSILSKLVDYVQVNEKKSLFPETFWDQELVRDGVESLATRITKQQKDTEDARQAQQERGKRSKIQFTSSASASLPQNQEREGDRRTESGRTRQNERLVDLDGGRHRDRKRGRSRGPERRR